MSDRFDGRDDPEAGGPAVLEGVARLLRAAGPRPDVPPERHARVREAVHDRWRGMIAARRRMRWIILGGVPAASAAAWAVLAATGLWDAIRPGPGTGPIATLERSAGPVLWPARPAPEAGASLDAGTVIETGTGGRVALRLGGGAAVRLDAGTAARLVSEAELLLERGAAYVDSGAGPGRGRPVAVLTPLGPVREAGTQFQVRALDGAVRLSVREGAATLEHRGRAHPAPSGTEITLASDGQMTSRTVAPSAPEWDWVLDAAPAFALEGRRLGDYLDWVARETGLRLTYADPTILADRAAVVLHGSVAGLRPDETLAAVLPTCGLRHRIDGGLLIVERTAQ